MILSIVAIVVVSIIYFAIVNTFIAIHAILENLSDWKMKCYRAAAFLSPILLFTWFDNTITKYLILNLIEGV